jgi:hypothetical protein
MRMMRVVSFVAADCRRCVARRRATAFAFGGPRPQLDQYKRNVGLEVDALQENIQKWNDSVFSFGELGFQEFETTKYLTAILKQNGFTIQEAWPASRRHGPRVGDRASR